MFAKYTMCPISSSSPHCDFKGKRTRSSVVTHTQETHTSKNEHSFPRKGGGKGSFRPRRAIWENRAEKL